MPGIPASKIVMELSLRCRCWSVLQVVAIVVCYRGKVLSEKVQGCVESRLSLRCPEMKVIQITTVVLGDSKCFGRSCCIRDDDCTYNPNENHIQVVYLRCHNKRSCTVDVLQESIYCGYVGWANNDFERITYNCTDDPQSDTTSSIDEQNKTDSDQTGNVHEDTPWLVPVVMATVCLLVFIAIVVVVVMMRRKRWPKGSALVEMTDIDISDRNEAIYANENQTVSPNGSGSAFNSNDKIKKSRGKIAKATDTYEVPNNGVYNLADDAGSRPIDDSNVYCDIDSREPTYLVPRTDVYSVVRVLGEPECAGSTPEAPNEDNNVYCDVETKDPAKANSSAQNNYDEAINWKESEYKAVKADKTIPPSQKKELASPAHKTASDSYNNVHKPLKNAIAFDSKAFAPGKVEAKDKLSTSDGFPSPSYETMSPGIPEGIYANAPALSPSWSVASRALSTGGSDTENPYCDMQSPPVRFKDDGSQTVVENDLYSH